MRRAILVLVTVFALGVAPAEAISVSDIIELSKSGLSDEILLALIDIEKKVFPVDTETLKLLKDSGVSEKVILAMVRSGRTQPVEMSAPLPVAPAPVVAPEPPEPRVVVIDHHEHSEPRVREVAVPVPVYVPVYVPRRGHPDHNVPPTAPFSTIGLTQPRMGLRPAPAKPTSDPPYWKQQQQQQR